nr:Ac81-like protein [Oryctes rhinoceros nudivirus]WDA64461.1 Ac81-like protein [Oryctes rhinoceros nudivirus]WDA64574.1 Ac81-like protein [Oryctes rhinoceros nudivirus]WDA64696.1 Ac81-like protein [Oryctes rhinoceros nudivirus]
MADVTPFKIVELRCQATRRSYGLFDHYFYVIDDKEVHMGIYRKGRILPNGTTKGSHIITTYEICNLCYDKLMLNLISNDDMRLFSSYFPILNCESLCTGFSIQSAMIISIPFIVVLIIKGYYLWAVILFLASIVVLLAYSKYLFSRTRDKKCSHLESR